MKLGCAISTPALVVSLNSGVKFMDEEQHLIFLPNLLDRVKKIDLIFCKVSLGQDLRR